MQTSLRRLATFEIAVRDQVADLDARDVRQRHRVTRRIAAATFRSIAAWSHEARVSRAGGAHASVVGTATGGGTKIGR